MTVSRALGRTTLVFTLSGLAVLACGEESPSDGDHGDSIPAYEGLGIAHSGTRLDATGSYFESGVGVGYDFYDNELETSCSVGSLSGDEQLYCVPSSFVEIVFPNDDCNESEAIAFVRETSCDASLATGDLVNTIFPPTDGDTCTSRRQLYVLGESVDAPTTRYWRSYPDGDCQDMNDERGGSFWTVEAAPRDGLARFTAATLESDDAEIAVRGYAGDDGSFQPVAFVFGERECRATPTARGTRCLPDMLRSTGQAFLDGSCETEATSVIGSSSACVENSDLVATLDDEVTCGEVVARVHAVDGEPVTAFTLSGDACNPWPEPTKAIVVGAEIELTAFPEFGEKWIREGALEASFVTSGGITIGNATGFRIAATKEPCQRSLFEGGERCVPGASFATAAELFSDASCASPLLNLYAGPCTVDVATVTYVERDTDSCSSVASAAYRVAPYDGDIHQKDSTTGDCISLEPAEGQLFFTRGAAIAEEDMPLLPRDRAR